MIDRTALIEVTKEVVVGCCSPDDRTGAELVDAILAGIEAQGYVIVQGWQPIETSPKTDMVALVHYASRVFRDIHGNETALNEMRRAVECSDVAWYQDGEWYQSGTGHDLFENWCIETGNIPTHWMPLLAAPAMLSAETGR